MTMLLAMAQRKILQSPGLTTPFRQFYYVSNLLTLILTLNKEAIHNRDTKPRQNKIFDMTVLVSLQAQVIYLMKM